MADPTTIPSRRAAIAMLERGDREVARLIERLPASARTRSGIGGGEWSPRDLVGHLASWQRHALEALDAWGRRERAPIDRALESKGLNGVNAETLAAAAALPASEILRDAHRTHVALIDAIRAMPDDRWSRPPLTTGRPLARRLGGIVGGPAGPFRHADAHLPDLRAFVRRSVR